MGKHNWIFICFVSENFSFLLHRKLHAIINKIFDDGWVLKGKDAFMVVLGT